MGLKFVSCYKEEVVVAKVGDTLTWEEYAAERKSILTNFNLSFNNHINMAKYTMYPGILFNEK